MKILERERERWTRKEARETDEGEDCRQRSAARMKRWRRETVTGGG